MIKIRKGSKTLLIPAGAYDTIYAPAGWEKEDNTAKAVEEPQKVEETPEPLEDVPEEESDEELDEEGEDVEYVDPEELNEKPLEELDFEELKILAEYLGINTKGLKSKKEVREAIKKFKSKK